MFGKMQKTIVLACFLVLFTISLAFSSNPAYYNLEEGANNVDYAYDSGSFMLQEGDEFTNISVAAKVQNGQSNQSMMTVEAYIEVGSWIVHVEASDKEGTEWIWEEQNTNGTGSCNEWYWRIDTRNNQGTGSAWCRWRWNTN